MFECFPVDEGKRKFRLTTEEGETILSSQPYTNKEQCISAIDATQKNAPLLDKFQRLTSSDGEPYFTLIDEKGLVLGTSNKFVSPYQMEEGIANVMIYGPSSDITERS